MIDRKAV